VEIYHMILVALLHCRLISACTVQIYCPKITEPRHNGTNDHYNCVSV